MYAVVSSGGKQYRVEQGSTLLVDRLAAEPGASITFDRVLLVSDGDEVMVGTPIVTGATVTGTVLGEERGPKLVIFKFKQKVKYRRRTGHRQQLTRIRIDEISANGAPKRRAAATADAEEKPTVADKPKAPARPRTRAAAKPKAAAEAAPAKAPAKPKAPARPRTRAAAKPKAEKAEKAEKPDAAAAQKKPTTTRRRSAAKPKE